MLPLQEQSQWHLKDGLPSPMEIGFILLNPFRRPYKDLKTQHSPFGSLCFPGTLLSENSYNYVLAERPP